jgi:hypothetical protein
MILRCRASTRALLRTRIEHYGVFVQIENSNVSGLTHMSHCLLSLFMITNNALSPSSDGRSAVANPKVGWTARHHLDDSSTDYRRIQRYVQ